MVIRLRLAWAVMQPSGTLAATQTIPLTSGPLPISSMIQASFLSAIENVSPELPKPYSRQSESIRAIASRAVLAR